MNAPAGTAPVLGARRDVTLARRTFVGLEDEIADAVEGLGVLEATPELATVFQDVAAAEARMVLRPDLNTERIVDKALIDDFVAARSALALERQEVAALHAEVHDATAALAALPRPPPHLWIAAMMTATTVIAGVVAVAVAALLALALDAFVVQRSLSFVAPVVSLAVSSGIATALAVTLVFTGLVATLGTRGRVPARSAWAGWAGKTLFALAFAAIRIGGEETSLWLGAAWSGFELASVILGAVMIAAIGRSLKRADKVRRTRSLAEEALDAVVAREITASARVLQREREIQALGLVIQEREEAAHEEAAAVALAVSTANVGILKGIARNKAKAAGGRS